VSAFVFLPLDCLVVAFTLGMSGLWMKLYREKQYIRNFFFACVCVPTSIQADIYFREVKHCQIHDGVVPRADSHLCLMYGALPVLIITLPFFLLFEDSPLCLADCTAYSVATTQVCTTN
jgi:hypothetical protein